MCKSTCRVDRRARTKACTSGCAQVSTHTQVHTRTHNHIHTWRWSAWASTNMLSTPTARTRKGTTCTQQVVSVGNMCCYSSPLHEPAHNKWFQWVTCVAIQQHCTNCPHVPFSSSSSIEVRRMSSCVLKARATGLVHPMNTEKQCFFFICKAECLYPSHSRCARSSQAA